jgi:hypothetical protein
MEDEISREPHCTDGASEMDPLKSFTTALGLIGLFISLIME